MTTPCYDEMREPDGTVRPAYDGYRQWLEAQPPGLLKRKGVEAEAFFRRTGITFNVYGAADAEDVGQGDLQPLFAGDVHAGDAGHVLFFLF